MWGVRGGRRVRMTTSPPSVSRLSRENVELSTSHNSNHGAKREKVTVYNILGHAVARNLLKRQTLTFSEQTNDNISILWDIITRRQYPECIEVSLRC
jgi:ribonuclease P protein component